MTPLILRLHRVRPVCILARGSPTLLKRDLFSLPLFIIGASAKTGELARKAEEWGADYVGSGAAFATRTKQILHLYWPEGIRSVAEGCSLPCVAIGGITHQNIPLLDGIKIAGAAVGYELTHAADPYDAAQKILFSLPRCNEAHIATVHGFIRRLCCRSCGSIRPIPFPVGPVRCYPIQHAVNVVAGILWGHSGLL